MKDFNLRRAAVIGIVSGMKNVGSSKKELKVILKFSNTVNEEAEDALWAELFEALGLVEPRSRPMPEDAEEESGVNKKLDKKPKRGIIKARQTAKL